MSHQLWLHQPSKVAAMELPTTLTNDAQINKSASPTERPLQARDSICTASEAGRQAITKIKEKDEAKKADKIIKASQCDAENPFLEQDMQSLHLFQQLQELGQNLK